MYYRQEWLVQGTHWNGIEHQNRGQSSSLFLSSPPRWQAERFKPQMVKTGFTLRLWVPSSQTLDWKVNLILIGVFCWQFGQSHISYYARFLFVPHSSLISTKPPTSSAVASLLRKGWGEFQPLAPPLPASCRVSSCCSLAPIVPFTSVRGWRPWLIAMRLKGIITLLILNVVN